MVYFALPGAAGLAPFASLSFGGTVADERRRAVVEAKTRRGAAEGAEGGERAGEARALAAGDVDALVERARTGDRGAFTELFRRHRRDVARLVFRMMGPRCEVDDLVQDVFLQVHRSLAEFRGQARFSTWLHRVTVNVVLMARRSARSRPVFSGEAIAEEREVSPALRPDEDAQRRMQASAFQALIDKLAEKKRTVFILHELEGLSPAEIGEIVGAPVLTVRTRLFYARRELEEAMRADPRLAHLAALGGASATSEAGDAEGRPKRGRPSKKTQGDETSGGRGEP